MAKNSSRKGVNKPIAKNQQQAAAHGNAQQPAPSHAGNVNQNKTANSKKKRWTFPRPSLTGLGFLVAVIAAAGTVWQAWISDKSAKAQLRAYVYVTANWVFEVGKISHYEIIIKNGGTTPALDIGYTFYVRPAPTPQRGERTKPPEVESHPLKMLPADFAYGEKTINVGMDTNTVDQATYDDIFMAHGQIVYMFGQVQYRDVFNKTHFVDYCFFFPVPGTDMGVCDYGNDTGDK